MWQPHGEGGCHVESSHGRLNVHTEGEPVNENQEKVPGITELETRLGMTFDYGANEFIDEVRRAAARWYTHGEDSVAMSRVKRRLTEKTATQCAVIISACHFEHAPIQHITDDLSSRNRGMFSLTSVSRELLGWLVDLVFDATVEWVSENQKVGA